MRSTGRVGLVTSLLLYFTLGCRGSTQVTVELFTDVTCPEVKGTTITAGPPDEIESRASNTVTPACESGGELRRIGSIVIIPSGGNDEVFGIKIVTGIDKDPDKCTEDNVYGGCIVARRSMRFVPHTPLYLPVVLRGSCKDVPCDAATTCVLGECVPAEVPDAALCVEPGSCGEGVLLGDTPLQP